MIDNTPNITFPNDANIKVSFGNDNSSKLGFLNDSFIDVSFGTENSSKLGFPTDKFAKVLEDNHPFKFRLTLGSMKVGSTFEVGIYYD